MTTPSTGPGPLGRLAPIGSHVRLVLREPSPGFTGERTVVLGQVIAVLDHAGQDAVDGWDAEFVHLRGIYGETASVRISDVSVFAADPDLDPSSGQPGPDTASTVVPVEELDDVERQWVTVMRERPTVSDGSGQSADTVRAIGRLVHVRPFKSGTGAELRLYPVLDKGGDDARHAANDDLPMTIDVGADDYVRVYDRR